MLITGWVYAFFWYVIKFVVKMLNDNKTLKWVMIYPRNEST